MKTFEDYYNDPAIADEISGLREVHAIRFMLEDQTKNMTVEEYHEFLWNAVVEGSKKYGFRIATEKPPKR